MKQIAFAALMAGALTAPARGGSYEDLNAGIQRYNLSEWNEAIAEFDKALSAKDLIPDQVFIAHYDRGRAHLHLSQFDQAIEDYSASLAVRPGETQVLIDRSLAYLDAGKLDQAASDLDTLVAARPQLASPYSIRAIVHIKRGQMDKSRDDLKTLLKLLPENTRRGHTVGILNWEVGQVSDAEDNFSYEADHGPNHVYAWLWYALAEIRLGKRVPKGSLPDFDKTAWPAPLIGFFTGETTQDAVFAAARQGDDDQIRGQVCEANFYVGEWLIQYHDQPAAKPLMAKAAGECPTSFIEWAPAQMDLAGLP